MNALISDEVFIFKVLHKLLGYSKVQLVKRFFIMYCNFMLHFCSNILPAVGSCPEPIFIKMYINTRDLEMTYISFRLILWGSYLPSELYGKLPAVSSFCAIVTHCFSSSPYGQSRAPSQSRRWSTHTWELGHTNCPGVHHSGQECHEVHERLNHFVCHMK
jgi:hypothetical protein